MEEEDSGGTNSEEGFDIAETTVLDPSGHGEIYRQKQSLKENVVNWNLIDLIQRLTSAHFMYRIQSPFN